MSLRSTGLVSVVVAWTAACPAPPDDAPPCSVTSAAGTTFTTREALSVIAPQVEFHVEAHGLVCLPNGAAACVNVGAQCIVDEEAIPVGDTRSVVVLVVNPAGVDLTIRDVSIGAGSCPDAYVDGKPPRFVAAGGSSDVRVVLRPLSAGPCVATLLIDTDAANIEPGAVPVIVVRGEGVVVDAGVGGVVVDGGPIDGPCGPPNACCCADGRMLDAPACDDGRLSCANGFLAFDDRCDVDTAACGAP